MPITDVSNFVFFKLINDYLRDEIDTFQWSLLTSTAQLIGAIGLTLLSLWILFQGFRIITGRTQQPMMALVGDSLRAVLILSIATGAASVSSNLYWTLTDGTTSAITALVSQNSDSPYANIDKNLAYMQGMLSAIDSLASGGDPSIDSAKDRAKWFSGIGIAGPGVIGGSILLLNKIAIALFVGFGPLFIMCLLFEQTKSLFSKWLLYGIGTVFSLAVLSFMVGLANNVIQGVAIAFLAKFALLLAETDSFLGSSTVSEGITSMALQQGGIGLVLTTLIVSAPPMAAAFFRGVLGQFQVFSAFGMIGRGTEGRYADHSWHGGETANVTNYGRADRTAIGESERSIMTGRVIQGTAGSGNAALDYIKSHEWSGMSDTSAPQTLGQRYVETYGGEALLTDAALDSVATEWSMRNASADAMRRSELEHQARLARGPQLSRSTSPSTVDIERTRSNLGMALAGPVVGAGLGIAAFSGGSAFLAGQMAKVPVVELGYSQLATGMATSGAFSAITYTMINGGEATPAGLAIAFSSGAMGGGLVKPALNFAAQLPNTAVPLTLSNFVTQGTGSAFGFGTFGWLNTASMGNSGQSWWTQPIYSPAKPFLGKQ